MFSKLFSKFGSVAAGRVAAEFSERCSDWHSPLWGRVEEYPDMLQLGQLAQRLNTVLTIMEALCLISSVDIVQKRTPQFVANHRVPRTLQSAR